MKIEFCDKHKEFRPYRIVMETDVDSDNLSWIMKYIGLMKMEVPMERRYSEFAKKINNQLDEMGIPYTCGYRGYG